MLRELLLSLAAQRYPRDRYEVIVVDNRSSDGTDGMVEEVARTTGLRVRRVLGEDRGPAPARNLGATLADAEILAFTDSDCVASSTWLEAGAKAFEDRAVGLVCGPILVPGNLEDPFLDLPVRTRFLLIDAENPFYPTANVLYRRAVFFDAGGFPAPDRHELMGQLQGGDDVELAWAVKRAGWKSSVHTPLLDAAADPEARARDPQDAPAPDAPPVPRRAPLQGRPRWTRPDHPQPGRAAPVGAVPAVLAAPVPA